MGNEQGQYLSPNYVTPEKVQSKFKEYDRNFKKKTSKLNLWKYDTKNNKWDSLSSYKNNSDNKNNKSKITLKIMSYNIAIFKSCGYLSSG